jgi:hypothetical protein
MSSSSLRLARTACVAALLVGIGGGIAAAQAVVVERAMPAPIVEVVPAAPGAGYNWVPVWRGSAWFWVKGHHIRGVVPAMPAAVVEVVPARPSPAHVWIKGHHAFEGGRAGSGIPPSGSAADAAGPPVRQSGLDRPHRSYFGNLTARPA